MFIKRLFLECMMVLGTAFELNRPLWNQVSVYLFAIYSPRPIPLPPPHPSRIQSTLNHLDHIFSYDWKKFETVIRSSGCDLQSLCSRNGAYEEVLVRSNAVTTGNQQATL